MKRRSVSGGLALTALMTVVSPTLNGFLETDSTPVTGGVGVRVAVGVGGVGVLVGVGVDASDIRTLSLSSTGPFITF